MSERPHDGGLSAAARPATLTGMPHPSRTAGLLLAGLVLGLLLAAGCSGEEEPGAAPTATVTVPAEPPAAVPSTASVPPGFPPRPAAGQCVTVGRPDDGVYRVYDAGSVAVLDAGGQLTISEVTPAVGWAEEIERNDPDEIVVGFAGPGAEELVLEVELDDGLLAAEICHES